MTNASSIALRIILVLAGLFTIFTGINVGFGGMQTLGWQGSSNFLEVTNESAFLVQDSHIRFFGGLWGAVGLFLILAATDLRRFQAGLKLVFCLIFVGGLTRLTMLRLDIVLGPNIIGSFLAEIVLMPILYFWLSRMVKPTPSSKD